MNIVVDRAIVFGCNPINVRPYIEAMLFQPWRGEHFKLHQRHSKVPCNGMSLQTILKWIDHYIAMIVFRFETSMTEVSSFDDTSAHFPASNICHGCAIIFQEEGFLMKTQSARNVSCVYARHLLTHLLDLDVFNFYNKIDLDKTIKRKEEDVGPEEPSPT
jgi:hypothetical protein